MLKGLARIVLFSAISVAVLVLAIAGIVRISAAVSSINSPVDVSLGSTSTTTSPGDAISIGNPNSVNQGTPPGIPTYTFGMWMSNNSPSVGGSMTVYAKVSHLSAPVVGTPVIITVGGQGISVTTDSNGIATLRVYASGPGKIPVEIDGSVTVGGQTLTASTFFTPI